LLFVDGDFGFGGRFLLCDGGVYCVLTNSSRRPVGLMRLFVCWLVAVFLLLPLCFAVLISPFSIQFRRRRKKEEKPFCSS
jgi:hypothetical protein